MHPMPAVIQKITKNNGERANDCYLITSAVVQAALKCVHFDPEYLAKQTTTRHQSNGRATTWFFNITESDQAVLRHYHRGGMAAKIADDQFLWTGINRTRAITEYRLCEWMFAQGLPVPEPLGARVKKHGIYYTCDLITRLYPNSQTMAQMLSTTTLNKNICSAAGNSIRRLHQHNIWHSDLNAHNILIDNHGQIKLIDFDRCRRRTGEHWKQKNLKRLKRSLDKLQQLNQIQHFNESMWQQILIGYYDGEATDQP